MILDVRFDEHGTPISLNFKKGEVYPLKEITLDELLDARKSGQRGIVYKKNGRFFYTTIERNVIFYNEKHMCNQNCSNVCKDCPRTRDLTVPFQMKYTKNRIKAIMKSWRIEKYDFITEGVETFNMTDDKDSFIVVSCENYQTKNGVLSSNDRLPSPPQHLKANLASLYFEDFNGQTEREFKTWRRSTFMRPIPWKKDN